MKYSIILFVFVIIITNCSVKDYSAQFIDEPDNPRLVSPEQQWDLLSYGLHAKWGSSDNKYQKDYIPGAENTNPAEIAGWKNERVSAQLVIWSKDTIHDIDVNIKSLSKNGGSFDKTAFNFYYIRNVLTDQFLRGCGSRDKKPEVAHITPDAFEKMEKYSNPARTTRGIWLTIDIPKDTESGTYNGEVEYTIFDKWVDFMMDLGIDKQINCYSIISKDGNYFYYDEAAEDTVMIAMVPGTPEYENFWTPFLIDFNKHILKRGLAEITTIAMDERPPEHMLPAISLIQRHTPDLKITLATDMKNDYSDDVYDLSIGLKHLSIKDIIPIRRDLNVITTFYVSCSSHYPNNFTFSQPAEGTWMGWYAFANDLSGFLRWAYNSWVEEPLYDSRFRTWPAGDAYLVYPGPKSSIRFEKIREGVQDYEKLRIVTEYLKASTNPVHEKLFDDLKNRLEYFSEDFPEQESITINVINSKQLLNELSGKLFTSIP